MDADTPEEHPYTDEEPTTLVGEIRGLKKEVAKLNQTATRRTRQLWVGTAVAVAVGVIGIVVSVVSFAVATHADNQFNAFLKDVTHRRVEACERDNVQAEKIRLVASKGAQAFEGLITVSQSQPDAKPIDPAVLENYKQQVIKPLKDAASIETGAPLAPRDCSPEVLDK